MFVNVFFMGCCSPELADAQPHNPQVVIGYAARVSLATLVPSFATAGVRVLQEMAHGSACSGCASSGQWTVGWLLGWLVGQLVYFLAVLRWYFGQSVCHLTYLGWRRGYNYWCLPPSVVRSSRRSCVITLNLDDRISFSKIDEVHFLLANHFV